MAERCIDANVAIKWFIKGEAFRRTAVEASPYYLALLAEVCGQTGQAAEGLTPPGSQGADGGAGGLIRTGLSSQEYQGKHGLSIVS